MVPSFWIVFMLVLYEGLLGGGVYGNAFYTVSKEVRDDILCSFVLTQSTYVRVCIYMGYD